MLVLSKDSKVKFFSSEGLSNWLKSINQLTKMSLIISGTTVRFNQKTLRDEVLVDLVNLTFNLVRNNVSFIEFKSFQTHKPLAMWFCSDFMIRVEQSSTLDMDWETFLEIPIKLRDESEPIITNFHRDSQILFNSYKNQNRFVESLLLSGFLTLSPSGYVWSNNDPLRGNDKVLLMPSTMANLGAFLKIKFKEFQSISDFNITFTETHDDLDYYDIISLVDDIVGEFKCPKPITAEYIIEAVKMPSHLRLPWELLTYDESMDVEGLVNVWSDYKYDYDNPEIEATWKSITNSFKKDFRKIK